MKAFRKAIRAAAAVLAGVCVLGSMVSAEETYMSELTGEPISIELKNQRPAAVIVDNEKIAYPHFGMAEADIVYELMNSTANGHITRLMALVKDWKNVEQIGNIRSVRTTNIFLAAEYNAFLCHDGGPFYVNPYFEEDYAKEHFSAGFTRVKNGKPWEFTEYIMKGELEKRFEKSGFSQEYTDLAEETESHFHFAPEGEEVAPAGEKIPAVTVKLPFEHTNSTLKYNEETRTYDYYCYGKLHEDEEDGEVLTFKNVIIQECPYTLYDENGYMVYDCVASGLPGYYITNGEAAPITWTKETETGMTRFYDADGQEITVNRGKTFVSLVPDDKWEDFVIE